MDFELITPVAMIVFNRPDTTAKVFEAVRLAKPKKLLIIADGPRADRMDEKEKCESVRSIIEGVDWDCEVLKNYSDVNLGCKIRVSSGLNWVFQTVEEAIVLEDDCLPHPSFFRYCQELLEKYRNDERIMLISGDNYQFGKNIINDSYYFSRYNHIWGWASWRRAWQYYDVKMELWDKIRVNEMLLEILVKKSYVTFWSSIFSKVYAGEINTWDYQWTFACWANRGLSILPKENLISNIGFGEDATHNSIENIFSYMSTVEMKFPMTHPACIVRNRIADEYYQKTFCKFSWLQYISLYLPTGLKTFLKKVLKK